MLLAEPMKTVIIIMPRLIPSVFLGFISGKIVLAGQGPDKSICIVNPR